MSWAGSREAEREHKAAVRAKGGEAKHAKKRPKKRKGKYDKRDGVDWVARQYGQRNRLLKELGIGPTYAEYLASGLWAGIRKRVLARDKCQCQICGEKAHIVHHQRYRKDNLLGLSLKHMFAICDDCHKLIESARAAACQAFDLARKHGKGLLKERKKSKKLTKAEKLERKKQKIRERQQADLRRKNRAKVLEIQRLEKLKAPQPFEIFRPIVQAKSNIPPTAWTTPVFGQ